MDTSKEESNQGEQTPLKVTIKKNNKRCLGGSGNQTILLPHPLTRYVPPGQNFVVII